MIISKFSISEYIYKNFSFLYNHTLDLATWNSIFEVERSDDFTIDIENHTLNFFQKQSINSDNEQLITFVPFSLYKRNSILSDLLINSFFVLSGLQELLIKERDKHNRIPYLFTLQRREDLPFCPLANIYLNNIAEILTKKGYEITIKKWDSPSGSNIVLTHDIDTIKRGRIETLGYIIKLKWLTNPSDLLIALKDVFSFKDPYYSALLRSCDESIRNNISSIYFLLTNSQKNNSDYSLKDLEEFFSVVKKTNNRLGLHSGYYSYNNSSMINKEIQDIERNSTNSINECRNHFLRFDSLNSISVIEETPIKIDYSLGFAEQSGFRNFCATPFFLFNFKTGKGTDILEVPLVFMDGTYSHYPNNENNASKAFEAIEELKKQKIVFCFSFLFHNTAFSQTKYKSSYKLFQRFINWSNENGFSINNRINPH